MTHRLTMARLLALWLALAPMLQPTLAMASQNTLQMPTTGTVSGLQFSNKVTDAFDSLVTCNSGSSAPTNAAGAAPKLGQCWLDTTVSTAVKKYRYSGTDWLLEGTIDVSNAIWTPPVGGGAATVVSATTTSLCSVPQAYLTISSTTTITGFGTGCPAGQLKFIKFSGILTLTYDATAMILPGAVSITTAVGDTAIAAYEGSGNWRVVNYSPATGQAVANPAVPVATKLDYFGAVAPASYVFGYGQALTRTSYTAYLAAVSIATSAVRVSGNNTLTSIADTSNMGAGMPIEGTGIPGGTTISSVTSSTIVMSANASTSGTSTATIITSGYGAGGSVTTVGVPDCRGRTIAGRDNMGGTGASRITTAGSSVDGTALNAGGGAQTLTIAQANLPNVSPAISITDPGHVHVESGDGGGGIGSRLTVNVGNGSNSSAGNTTVSATTGITASSASINGGVTQTAMNKLPPVLIANCIVRVTP